MNRLLKLLLLTALGAFATIFTTAPAQAETQSSFAYGENKVLEAALPAIVSYLEIHNPGAVCNAVITELSPLKPEGSLREIELTCGGKTWSLVGQGDRTLFFTNINLVTVLGNGLKEFADDGSLCNPSRSPTHIAAELLGLAGNQHTCVFRRR